MYPTSLCTGACLSTRGWGGGAGIASNERQIGGRGVVCSEMYGARTCAGFMRGLHKRTWW